MVYNYRFERGQCIWLLVTGGSGVGTTRSGGWLFDGQVFTRSKEHPYLGKIDGSELKIVTLRHIGEKGEDDE